MRALTNPLFYILVSILSSLVACNHEPENEVTNLDQIRPKAAATEKQVETKNTADTLSDFLKTYANDSCQLKMAAVFIDSSQAKHFLNRFSKQHFHLVCRDSMNQIFGHQEWSFKDTNQAKEAFFNWIDQFESHQPFHIGSAEKIFNVYTLITLAANKIVQINSAKKIKYHDWLRLLSSNFKNANFSYVIWAQPKKNTKWYRYKNAQLLTL